MRSWAALLISLLIACSAPAQARDRFDIVLGVEMQGYTLSDGLLAYQENGMLLLPMAEMASILDFYVEADPGQSQITGWVLNEDRKFALHGRQGTITSGGDQFTIPPSALLADLGVVGEAYLPIETLSQIWPVDFLYQPRRLRVIVRAREPLPLQQRLEREQARNEAFNAANTRSPQDLPDATVPYRMFSGGFARVETELNFDAHVQSRIAINAHHDLLGAAATWSYANSFDAQGQESPGFFHISLERQAAVGDLPFGIARLRIGDISTPSGSEVVRSGFGRGIEISSFGETDDVFDEIDVEGNAPPGWEAELYINNALIGFQVIETDGRYDFEDIPVQFGTNFVEVRLFGPHGEIETDTRTIEIPPQSARRGELAWAVRFGETVPVFEFDNDTAQTNDALWFQSNAAYGIGEFLTLHAGLATAQADGETYALGSIGPGIAALDAHFKPRLLFSDEGVFGAGASLSRNFEQGHFTLEGTYFNGIETPELGIGDDALRYYAEADIAFSAAPARVRTLFTLNATAEEQVDGDKEFEVLSRQVITRGRTNLSNQIRWRDDGDTTETTGRLILAIRHDRFEGRLAANYNFAADETLSQIEGTVGYRTLDRAWRWTATASHSFEEDEVTFGATLARRFDHFDLGASARVGSESDASFGLRFTSTVGLTEVEGLTFAPGDATGEGIAQVIVFLDANADGKIDPGEAPIPGVGVRVNNGIGWDRTDPSGRILLHGLSTRHRSNVTIDLRTLEDPMLLPGNEGYSLIARPGTMARLEIPVVETGLIEGKVSGPDDRPAIRTAVILRSPDGAEQARTSTAYDGYFAFEPLRLGTYIVALEDDANGREVVLTSDEPFVYGAELITD